MGYFTAMIAWTVLVAGCLAATGTAADAPPRQQRGVAIPTYEAGGYTGPEVDTDVPSVTRPGVQWVEIIPEWFQGSTRASDTDPSGGARATRMFGT
jgi:hypothetical protein